jgi:IS605 OrfB family transposase
MSFLTRYGKIGILNDLNDKLTSGHFDTDLNKKIFMENVIFYLNKFSEARLINLALSRRNRIYKSLKLNDFKSLSFKSQSRIKDPIVQDNKNKKSVINGFITIGGYENVKKISIPVKISNKYHGKKSDFAMTYTIQFKEDKPARFILSKEQEIEIPENNTNYLGVDTNIKHNLFQTSDKNISIDYDRNMITDFCKVLEKLDSRTAKKLNKKRRKRYLHWQNKIKNMVIEKVVSLVKQAKLLNYNHLILEDLECISKMPSKSQEFDIKNGRLMRILNLSSVKHAIRRIAWKYGISVSFVQAEYTSQLCPKCGNIDKNNRKVQEIFSCTCCDYNDNADYVSSINIRNRITQDVLVKKLLNFDGQEFNPKSLSHKQVIEIITDFYDKESSG